MMFSIIIPSHNSNGPLRNALKSCLAQTFADFEVIVIDDASREPAESVCADLADPRVRCFRNERNLGASASRNIGLDAARGDYVAFLDADDLYLPRKLEVLASAIAAENSDVLLHRQYRVQGSQAKGFIHSELPRQRIPDGEPIEEFTFRGGNYYNINVICVRRSIARSVRFRSEMRMLEDQAFVYDCVRFASKVTILDDLLAVYVDDSRDGRASKRYRSADDYAEFQAYAAQHLTLRGQALIEATIASDLSFFRHPLRVIKAILSGYRAGMPLPRTIFYAFRSVVGANIANSIMDLMISRSARTLRQLPESYELARENGSST